MAHVLYVSLYFFSLTCFVHHTIAETYVDLAKVVGKNRYFPGEITKTLKFLGFQQCLKVCGRNTNCLSINYNQEQLTCELLSTAAGDQTPLETRTGYVYAKKEENLCKELQCSHPSECLRTSVGTPVCLNNLLPRDCQDIAKTKVQSKTVQRIYPFNDEVAKEVQCALDGQEIWTIIQRRFDGSEDFYRTWAEYKKGFGKASGDYWIGNDVLHALTTAHNYHLFIESVDWNYRKAYAKYTTFSMTDEDSQYILSISGYSGNYGDDMQFLKDRPFSTKDKPVYSKSNVMCSYLHRSGWWYRQDWEHKCTHINPNGEFNFGVKEANDMNYMIWDYFKGTSSLRSFVIKIRRNY